MVFAGPLPHDSEVNAFFDQLASDPLFIPPGAQPVTQITELSPELQRLAERGQAGEQWRAWKHEDGRCWFVRARISKAMSHVTNGAAILVFFHDPAGEITQADTWVNSNGRWVISEPPGAKSGRPRGKRL